MRKRGRRGQRYEISRDAWFAKSPRPHPTAKCPPRFVSPPFFFQATPPFVLRPRNEIYFPARRLVAARPARIFIMKLPCVSAAAPSEHGLARAFWPAANNTGIRPNTRHFRRLVASKVGQEKRKEKERKKFSPPSESTEIVLGHVA